MKKTVTHLAYGAYGVACGLWGEKGVRAFSLQNVTCKQCLRSLLAREMFIKRLEGRPKWQFTI